MNFSRVHWDYDITNGKYSRKKDSSDNFLSEYNWVWNPQGVINVHHPEKWGYVIFGTLLLSGIDEVNALVSQVTVDEKATLLDQMADSVFVPYLVMAGVLFVLGLLMRKAPLPNVETKNEEIQEQHGVSKKTIFQYPHLWFGMLTLFVYVGGEVIAGDTIIAYGLALGISAAKAKFFTTFMLLAMVATYALGVVLIPKYLSQKKALEFSALMGLGLGV